MIFKNLPASPGVYQMYDKDGQILYVGKAKNLKKRVASYFRADIDLKTEILVKQIANIEVVVTATENEALLLENTLIKKLKPKYNILFKDDKS
jgi:excinuclease ABC subunit C